MKIQSKNIIIDFIGNVVLNDQQVIAYIPKDLSIRIIMKKITFSSIYGNAIFTGEKEALYNILLYLQSESLEIVNGVYEILTCPVNLLSLVEINEKYGSSTFLDNELTHKRKKNKKRSQMVTVGYSASDTIIYNSVSRKLFVAMTLQEEVEIQIRNDGGVHYMKSPLNSYRSKASSNSKHLIEVSKYIESINKAKVILNNVKINVIYQIIILVFAVAGILFLNIRAFESIIILVLFTYFTEIMLFENYRKLESIYFEYLFFSLNYLKRNAYYLAIISGIMVTTVFALCLPFNSSFVFHLFLVFGIFSSANLIMYSYFEKMIHFSSYVSSEKVIVEISKKIGKKRRVAAIFNIVLIVMSIIFAMLLIT